MITSCLFKYQSQVEPVVEHQICLHLRKFSRKKTDVLMLRECLRQTVLTKLSKWCRRRRRFSSIDVDVDVGVGVARGGFSFHYLFKPNTCFWRAASPFNSSCFRFCFSQWKRKKKRTKYSEQFVNQKINRGKTTLAADFGPTWQLPTSFLSGAIGLRPRNHSSCCCSCSPFSLFPHLNEISLKIKVFGRRWEWTFELLFQNLSIYQLSYSCLDT